MPKSKGTFETIAPDHPISTLACSLSDKAHEFAAGLRISKFDVAVAFVNAAGHVLADSKDMPREAAIGRMDDLRRVMEAAYDLRKIDGSA